jgi:GNAT superfamily N-acetyltransferase
VALEIHPVTSRRDLREFVELPYRLYDNDPYWVPPLRFDVKKRLDRAKNPFFRHAEAEYFLARRDGRPVGRISAHVDENFNRFQDNDWGLFGWLEAAEDPEAVAGLLDAAERWLRARGRDRMVGPFDFTTNDPCGVLVDGFDRLPTILNPWTKPYYPGLLDGAGLEKAMDLLMWELHIEGRERVHQAIWDVAKRVETDHGIVCRPMRKSDMQAEVERFLEVYNAAWERNWGFVPLADDEVRAYAKELKPVLDEHWAFVAEKRDTGEVVGAALTLPDYNQVFRHMNGRLLPFGLLRLLRDRKKIDRVRVFALGVKPEYQHTGVAARFYEMHFDSAEVTPQTHGEMGWILEVNRPMNRAMQGMGGDVVSRYRLYERRFSDDAAPAWPEGARGWGDAS